MYNHYMRDSNGNYVKVSVEDPPASAVHIPSPSESPETSYSPPSPKKQSYADSVSDSTSSSPVCQSRPRPSETQSANRLLGRLNLSDIDSGDLLLLALLFFLFRENADEELLIALGLLLIL